MLQHSYILTTLLLALHGSLRYSFGRSLSFSLPIRPRRILRRPRTQRLIHLHAPLLINLILLRPPRPAPRCIPLNDLAIIRKPLVLLLVVLANELASALLGRVVQLPYRLVVDVRDVIFDLPVVLGLELLGPLEVVAVYFVADGEGPACQWSFVGGKVLFVFWWGDLGLVCLPVFRGRFGILGGFAFCSSFAFGRGLDFLGRRWSFDGLVCGAVLADLLINFFL